MSPPENVYNVGLLKAEGCTCTLLRSVADEVLRQVHTYPRIVTIFHLLGTLVRFVRQPRATGAALNSRTNYHT